MTININGVDKTSLVDWTSYEMINVLTKEIDTFSFSLKVHPGQTYKPTIGKEVTVYEGATKIYGGIITEIERKIEGLLQVWTIFCKDYTHLLDRKLVKEPYKEGYAGDIIKAIISKYTTGFTTNNVAQGPFIDSITFNYEQLSRAIQEIANRTYYDW